MNAEEYLTQVEKDKIIAFNEDKVLKGAVQKVLLEAIYHNGVIHKGQEHDPARNFALTEAFDYLTGRKPTMTLEELGTGILTDAKAIQKVEQAFAELGKIVKEDKKDKEENPAE